MHRLKRNEALLGKHKHGAINSFPQTAFAKQQPTSFLQLCHEIWGVYSEKEADLTLETLLLGDRLGFGFKAKGNFKRGKDCLSLAAAVGV